MVGKLHILHGHSDKEQTKLLNLFKTAILCLVSLSDDSLANDVHIGLMDIVRSDEVEVELKEAQKLFLLCQNLLLRERIVRDLLRYNLGVQWIYVLIL